MKKIIFAMVLVSSMSQVACLRTRSDIQEEEQRRVLTENLKKSAADRSAEMAEMKEQINQSRGQIEILESKLENLRLQREERRKAEELEKTLQADRINTLKEAIQKLEAEIKSLRKSAPAKSTTSRSKKTKGPFTSGERDFKAKRWEQAIVNYENYRKRWPNGSRYPEATYKIGVSFQELKMKSEAKVFYKEVIQKFPKSKEAKKAKIRLSKLK